MSSAGFRRPSGETWLLRYGLGAGRVYWWSRDDPEEGPMGCQQVKIGHEMATESMISGRFVFLRLCMG